MKMALSQQEEAFLRQQIAEQSPMKVVNPLAHVGRGLNESIGSAARHVTGLFRRSVTVVADLNQDAAISNKLSKLKFRKQEMAELNGFSVVVTFPDKLFPGDIFALGITRDQVLQLSVDSLKRRIITARAEAIELGLGSFPMHGPAAPSTRPTNPSYRDTGVDPQPIDYEMADPSAI
jgi:hypothetical protein